MTTLGIRGMVRITLIGSKGFIKFEINFENTFTTVGAQQLAARMAANSPSPEYMRFLAVGFGGSEAFRSDTALESESGSRLTGTITSSGGVYKNTATFPAGDPTGTIREIGLFDSITFGGNMGARSSNFSPFVKAAGDSMEVIWELEVK